MDSTQRLLQRNDFLLGGSHKVCSHIVARSDHEKRAPVTWSSKTHVRISDLFFIYLFTGVERLSRGLVIHRCTSIRAHIKRHFTYLLTRIN